MDDGMMMGTLAGLHHHHHHDDQARDSVDKGRCGLLCAVCRRRCCRRDGDRDGTTTGCTAVVCGSVCTRTMLVVVNLTFLLAGWTLIGVGLWIHIFQESLVFSVLFRDNPTDPLLLVDRLPVAMIGAGLVVTVIGFLGCCGACTESVCFLAFYAVLLVLSFVAQVAIATLAVTFHKQVQLNLVASMQYQIRFQYNTSAKITNQTDTVTFQTTTAWDKLQMQMNCCGVAGPQDYMYSLWYNRTPHSDGPFVPTSCCRALLLAESPRNAYMVSDNECQMAAIKYAARQQEAADEASGDRDEPKAQGCYVAVVNWLSEYVPFIFFILALDVLQLMNVIYACMLINLVRRKQVDYSWCEDDDLD